ncbi:hypothetical protein T01_9641 [Trichinella spiralis]|uniref:Uncharacterized protein n=1 Tax=Trichinella spiralis TaxID=6334 RepID=A0A0V1BGZ0_TRISP|nr:hypothetical protein T01_9641 [Trichinella spiralis]
MRRPYSEKVVKAVGEGLEHSIALPIYLLLKNKRQGLCKSNPKCQIGDRTCRSFPNTYGSPHAFCKSKHSIGQFNRAKQEVKEENGQTEDIISLNHTGYKPKFVEPVIISPVDANFFHKFKLHTSKSFSSEASVKRIPVFYVKVKNKKLLKLWFLQAIGSDQIRLDQ